MNPNTNLVAALEALGAKLAMLQMERRYVAQGLAALEKGMR